MFKENHPYWDDASNDLYKLSGLSGMDYIRSLPENMAYSLPIPPNIDVEENDNHSSPNLIIETKGDDFFNILIQIFNLLIIKSHRHHLLRQN